MSIMESRPFSTHSEAIRRKIATQFQTIYPEYSIDTVEAVFSHVNPGTWWNHETSEWDVWSAYRASFEKKLKTMPKIVEEVG